MNDFTFERLNVYQESMNWLKVSEGLINQAGHKMSSSMANQFSRAALSIPLNIAEGNGRWHKADKRQFFWIARGSAFECVPIVSALHEMGAIDTEVYSDSRSRLIKISKMLTGLIQSVEKLKQ